MLKLLPKMENLNSASKITTIAVTIDRSGKNH
jgi:hypothetical protein